MKFLVLFFSTVTLSACVTTGPIVQNLESKKTVSFTNSTPISNSQAYNLVADGLLNQSKLKRSITWRSGYRKIETRASKQGIVIDYASAQTDGSSSRRLVRTVTSVTVPVAIESGQNLTKITVSEPTDIKEVTGRTMLFLPVPAYDSSDDYRYTRHLVNNLALAAYKQKISKDTEIASIYNSNSIRANFSRLANCEVSDDNRNPCVIEGVKTHIKIFDYRDGSKVMAKLSTEKSYFPDGSSDSTEAENNWPQQLRN